MFDIFYIGKKPNLFVHERAVESIEQAQKLSRTRYFWMVSYLCDYTNWDFLWEPVPWESEFVHVWPSQWHQYSGTYLCNKNTAHQQQWKFHKHIVKTKVIKDNWTVHYPVHENKFDWSWAPHPMDPPYNYVWGNQHWPPEIMPTVEYRVPGAIKTKYMEEEVYLVDNLDNWVTPALIYEKNVDYSWVPNPKEPLYIYEFATQHQPNGGACYIVPGATKRKYIEVEHRRLADESNWIVPEYVDKKSIDFSWHPSNTEEPYIYEFGTQHQFNGGARYIVPGATEVKYVGLGCRRVPDKSNWVVPANIDPDSIDFSWHPDNTELPYIYEFATQHQPNGGARYVVPGATEVKYVDIAHRRLADKTNWIVPDSVDLASIDFSWHPSNTEEPYIYEFATQHQPNGGARYVVPGATEVKYVDLAHRRCVEHSDHWNTLEDCKFDYSWHPSNTEKPYIYVFGNQHYPGTIMPTVTYTVPGATEEKFVDLPVAQLFESRANWEILEPIDEAQWDWTWRPNPKDPPYIYDFGNQWNPAEYKASVRYRVPGATETKYMEQRTVRLPQPDLFRFNLAVSDFDYSWEPNPFDPPMTYAFGNQWNPAVIEPTVVYNAGGTEVKYMDEPVAQVAQDMTHWEILDEIQEFDYSWRPNPTDPPYIYVFGNQWLTPEQRPAVRYVVPTATQLKYIDEPKAQRVGNPEKFNTFYDCDFDYSWEPDPGSPPYNYVFGNQHWPAEIMPTVKYTMAGATANKFVDEPVAKLKPTTELWNTVTDIPFDFDYSWCPDPGDPPYIYVFGNQWYPAEEMPTVEYRMPGATERKYVDSQRAKLLPVMERWDVPEEINVSNIDFSWVPHPKDDPYIHHFGSEYQMSTGLTYTVPGAVEPKFEGSIPLIAAEAKPVTVLDIFYMDRSNAMSQQRFIQLQEKYPNIQKVRYVNSVLATIKRCADKAKTRKFWVIGSENDYADFDFAWHAEPWQNYMTHVFGSQWNKWSDTFLINKWEFERHSQWAKGIEEFPNLNFVADQLVHAPADANNIYVVDHGNASWDYLTEKYRVVKSARYFDNYLDTLRRLIVDIDDEHIWVVSSLCDYSRFDFSWQPEAWQRDMLHVFPSNEQKFGDTFYVPVKKLREQIDSLELLDWFDTINYCNDQQVPRWSMPTIIHKYDTHVESLAEVEWTGPFALLSVTKDVPKSTPTVSLWRDKTKTIVPLSPGASSVIVPKSAIPSIKTQLYDYPYIDKTHTHLTMDQPLDIVFISNGESNAEYHYDWLVDTVRQGNFKNAIKRVSGVNGRVAAYQAAAELSSTPWFFAVFAKLEVDINFDFYWQPDRMQQPKHYIFHAKNPVNGLIYGHQAMIAYNKKLTLSNTGQGLDFTLDDAHEVVPVVSGTAYYNDSRWVAWRTAFREVLKLKASLPNVESAYRIKKWCAMQDPDGYVIVNEQYSIWGALDAIEYYDSVNGDFDQLKKSYEWDWLASYAFLKRNLTTDQ